MTDRGARAVIQARWFGRFARCRLLALTGGAARQKTFLLLEVER
jgi:hypothetical protein